MLLACHRPIACGWGRKHLCGACYIEHLWNPTLAAKGASRMGHPLLLWLEKKVQEREREPADRRIVSGEAHLSGPEGGRRLPTGAVLSP